jgi:hypothetical protein
MFIWVERGNAAAARLMDEDQERFISVQSYMELLQCARDARQQERVRSFLREFGFRTLPLTEGVGHRAAMYIEQYSLSNGLRTGDAIVAATAAEQGLILCSSNVKHFRPIRDLKFRGFRPLRA